jgi:hypothetical protein
MYANMPEARAPSGGEPKTDLVMPLIPVEVSNSVARNLKASVTSDLSTSETQRYLRGRFPVAEKIVVKGKKSGIPEVRCTNTQIVVTVSPDSGAWKKFCGSMATSSSRSGESQEGSRNQPSQDPLLLQKVVDSIVEWGRRNFTGEPPQCLIENMPSDGNNDGLSRSLSEAAKFRLLLTHRQPTGSDGDKSSAFDPRLRLIRLYFENSNGAKDYDKLWSTVVSEITKSERKIFLNARSIDSSEIPTHAASLGKLGVLSLMRFFAERDLDVFRAFSKQIVQVYDRAAKVFEEQISGALQRFDTEALEALVHVPRCFLSEWSSNSVFAVLGVINAESQAAVATRQEYEGVLASYENRIGSLIQVQNEVREEVVDPARHPIEGLIPSLLRLVPTLGAARSGDLLSYTGPLDEFGRRLLALARSTDQATAKWYRVVTAGGRQDTRGDTPNGAQLDDDFPEFILELLQSMCAWARSPVREHDSPAIQRRDDLYLQLVRAVVFHGALGLFAAMVSRVGEPSAARLKDMFNSMEDLLKILSVTGSPTERQAAFLGVAKYFAKFEVNLKEIKEAKERAAYLSLPQLFNEASRVILECGEQFLMLPADVQVDSKPEAGAFLARIWPTIDFLDRSGALGKALSVLEVAIAMFDAVKESNQERRRFVLRHEKLTNEIHQYLEEVERDWKNRTLLVDDARKVLKLMQVDLLDRQPKGGLSRNREHCIARLGRVMQLVASPTNGGGSE